METFIEIMLIVCGLAFASLFITGCIVGIYFLFNLMA